MAIIRKYERGDVESIAFNDFGKHEWGDDADKSALEQGEAYTIIVGDYKCVVCVQYTDELYFIWMTPDKRISPIYIKYVKFIVDKISERGLPMFTMSSKGRMQTKMHKFLGCRAIGTEKGNTIWLYERG